jgi:hypothetical protein
MTIYNVTLLFEANDELGVIEVSVEAESLFANADWILFHEGKEPNAPAHTVVAAFPKESVVSVLKES